MSLIKQGYCEVPRFHTVVCKQDPIPSSLQKPVPKKTRQKRKKSKPLLPSYSHPTAVLQSPGMPLEQQAWQPSRGASRLTFTAPKEQGKSRLPRPTLSARTHRSCFREAFQVKIFLRTRNNFAECSAHTARKMPRLEDIHYGRPYKASILLIYVPWRVSDGGRVTANTRQDH